MKRSDVLKLLEDDVKDVLIAYDIVDGYVDDKFFKNHAELILRTIESAGMLPPSYVTRLENGLEVKMIDWEPEDDK